LFRNQSAALFVIFLTSLFLFTVGLSHQEIIGFESRFYLFALEMGRHGPRWFPTTYGVSYPDYPVTSTLLIDGVAKIVGHLNKWVAVLPTAIAAALTLSVTYAIGALHDKRWGLLAVFFMLLTNTFVMEARTISPDQYIVLITTFSFYLIYSATMLNKSGRLYFIPILLLLGFACRGPIGLVVPAGVVCLFYLLEKNYKQFFVMGLSAVILLAAGCLVLLGVAHFIGGTSFVMDVWHTEVSGRMQDAYLPWYFYFTESVGAYALTYPLAMLVLVGVMWRRSEIPVRDVKLLLKLTAWTLVILIGLTIPAGKKIRYILAMTPALALISAALFVIPLRGRYWYYLQKIVSGICLFLPLLCLLLIGLAWWISHHGNAMALDIWNNVEPTACWAVVMLSILQIVQLMKRHRMLWIVGGAALTFCLSYMLLVEPVNIALNTSKDFVSAVEAARIQHHAKLVFYQENPDGTPIKYVASMTQEAQPIFISTPEKLLAMRANAIFIADPQHYAALPKTILQSAGIIYSGSVGHNKLVAFEF
jgi:4-amino-4-deoxy-L-arabinose transferase-like glycosyltransferase